MSVIPEALSQLKPSTRNLKGPSEIQFKIDTGAEVSVIPEALSQPFSSILKPSTRNLKGPSKQELQVCGQFTCLMRLDKETTKQEVYVVKGLDLALVRLPCNRSIKPCYKGTYCQH